MIQVQLIINMDTFWVSVVFPKTLYLSFPYFMNFDDY